MTPEQMLAALNQRRDAADTSATDRYSARADSMIDRIRRAAMEGTLSDAEMEWYQADQARARSERDAAESERSRQFDSYIQAVKQALLEQAAPQAAAQDDSLRPTIENAAKLPPSQGELNQERLVSLLRQAPQEMRESTTPPLAPAFTSKREAQLAGMDPRNVLASIAATGGVIPDILSLGNTNVYEGARRGANRLMGNTDNSQRARGAFSDENEYALGAAEGLVGLPKVAMRGAKEIGTQLQRRFAPVSEPRMRTIGMGQEALPAPAPRGGLTAASAPPALERPPAGPYGGEDLSSFLQRLNRDMDEINAPSGRQWPPREPFIEQRGPTPTEQPSLFPEGAMPPHERAARGPTNAQLRTELREAAGAGGGIDRLGRLRRLDKEIRGFGDTTDIPRAVVMKELQRLYKQPFAKKGAGGLKQAQQMSLSLPERGRVAKEQSTLIDPWGQVYNSVPTLFRNGGRV